MEPPSPELALPMLQSVMDALSSCTIVTGPTGRILMSNRTWEVFKHRNPFISDIQEGMDYLETCRSLLKGGDGNVSIIALAIISAIQGSLPSVQMDYPIKNGGDTRWFGMTATHATHSGALGAIIQHQDITERMQLERRLRRSEDLFKATTENALDLITMLGENGAQIYNSPAYQKILGFTSHELAALSFLDLVHPEDQIFFSEAVKLGLRRGLSQSFEYRLRHREGGWRFMEAKAAMVENLHGSQETVLLISRDITDRKDAECERAQMEIQLRHSQKLEAIGQLAAGIAHEINTPTQFISDNVQFLNDAFVSISKLLERHQGLFSHAGEPASLGPLLQDLQRLTKEEDMDYLMEEVPKAIKQSLDGLQRVSTIVQAMKYFSHPGTEGRVTINLNHAIQNTLIVARNEWKYVADITQEFDENLPMVSCIPGEFNQVILNLVVNAAHAIGDTVKGTEQKGTIHITTAQDGEWAVIRLRDNGTGIPESIQSQIFLPFFTTKQVGKGTGQGLSIVHGVITKHGGTVSFESEVGKGTTFEIRLPIKAPSDPETYSGT